MDLNDKINKSISYAYQLFKNNPPDLRMVNDQDAEITYVENSLNSYLRTISDVVGQLNVEGNLNGFKIIELGAFLGIVSKSLSLMGADVVACDIPEFFSRANVIDYYKRLNIPIESFNLRKYKLPFADASQDCVIACEILEHLNFNPLPAIVEINRVLKPNGLLYIAMPNGAYVLKRIKYLFTGDTPGFSVPELYQQLDPMENMVVGLHWKEYSPKQTCDMLTPLGFELINLRQENFLGNCGLLKKIIAKLLPGGNTQVAIFRKKSAHENKFLVSSDS